MTRRAIMLDDAALLELRRWCVEQVLAHLFPFHQTLSGMLPEVLVLERHLLGEVSADDGEAFGEQRQVLVDQVVGHGSVQGRAAQVLVQGQGDRLDAVALDGDLEHEESLIAGVETAMMEGGEEAGNRASPSPECTP